MFILQGLANIENVVAGRTDKKPPGTIVFFFKHGMESIFISTGGTHFKFIFHFYRNNLIVHKRLLFIKDFLSASIQKTRVPAAMIIVPQGKDRRKLK